MLLSLSESEVYFLKTSLLVKTYYQDFQILVGLIQTSAHESRW